MQRRSNLFHAHTSDTFDPAALRRRPWRSHTVSLSFGLLDANWVQIVKKVEANLASSKVTRRGEKQGLELMGQTID
jgi:hypothetical protein